MQLVYPLSIKDCQECESALLNVKEKELEKIKANESAIFDKWMKDGVPDGVKPSVNAGLRVGLKWSSSPTLHPGSCSLLHTTQPVCQSSPPQTYQVHLTKI